MVTRSGKSTDIQYNGQKKKVKQTIVQKRVVHTKLDIYVSICLLLITTQKTNPNTNPTKSRG